MTKDFEDMVKAMLKEINLTLYGPSDCITPYQKAVVIETGKIFVPRIYWNGIEWVNCQIDMNWEEISNLLLVYGTGPYRYDPNHPGNRRS